MAEPTLRCEADPVFLALSRPPMFFGITDAYAVFMVVVVMIVFLGLGGIKGILYGLATAPAMYVFGYAMCERDARIFQLWGVKLAKFSAGRRRSAYWGGVSFDPGVRMEVRSDVGRGRASRLMAFKSAKASSKRGQFVKALDAA